MTLLAPISPHKTVSSGDNRGWLYRQPSTGYEARSLDLNVLIAMVEKHRWALAGNDIEMDLQSGWQIRLLNDICLQNPKAPCGPNPQDPNWVSPHIEQGRALWKELHDKADSDFDPNQLNDWLNRWLDRAPSYGCKCRDNAIALLREMPPDFSKEGFKAWGIAYHNAVRKKLGQKQWPF